MHAIFGAPAMALDEFLLGINSIFPLDGDIPQVKKKTKMHIINGA
jgi:hypothetical protein